jgi:hypothetical protein
VEYGAGAQLSGQQGYTNEETKAFELTEPKRVTKTDGAADNTETLPLPAKRFDRHVPSGAPKAPKADCWISDGTPRAPKGFESGQKRRRPEDARMEMRKEEDDIPLNYG